MTLVFRKLLVPSALLLALIFFVGTTLAPAVLAGQVQGEQCCDQENLPQAPADDGECFDCNCPTCQFVMNTPAKYPEPLTVSASAYSWLVSKAASSGFIRTIDYPPEVS